MSLKNIVWEDDDTPGRRVITDSGERFEPLRGAELREAKKLLAQEEAKERKPKQTLKLRKKQKLRLKSKPASKPFKKIKHANGQVAHALKDKAEFKIGDPVPEKRYTMVSRDVILCPEVRGLSHWDKHLLFCLLIQYDGTNNGKLKCSFAYMNKHFGWGSPNTLLEARKNLVHAQLLAQISAAYKGRAARYGLINCLVPVKGVEQ